MMTVIVDRLAAGVVGGTDLAMESDYDWWRAARFGIFVHWVPSSLLELPQEKHIGRVSTEASSPTIINIGCSAFRPPRAPLSPRRLQLQRGHHARRGQRHQCA
jgi:hypothetical protein